MSSYLKAACAVGVLALTALPAAAATLAPWTISGFGTSSSVTAIGDDGASFTYSGSRSATYTAEALVTEGGLFDFDWTFSGFHAYHSVRAHLLQVAPTSRTLVNAGPTNCCTTPSAGFDFSGTSSVMLAIGDTLRFTFGGSNSDSNPTVMGTVTISEIAPVPIAPAGVLLLSALGLGALGRRMKRGAANPA